MSCNIISTIMLLQHDSLNNDIIVVIIDGNNKLHYLFEHIE